MASKSPSESVKPYRCEAHVSFDGRTCARCGVDLEDLKTQAERRERREAERREFDEIVELCELCETRKALPYRSNLGSLCRECEIAEVGKLDDRTRQGLGIVDRTGN